VVGPICETGDFFARDRELPLVSEEICWPFWTWARMVQCWDRTTTRAAGRRRAVDGARARMIRRRESVQDQMRMEKF